MASGKGGKVVTSVTEVVKSVIENMGFELVEVEYVKEGPNWYLRLYVDKKGGISIDECAEINDAVDPLIDKLNPIEDAYIFEVSSPGLDRPLKTEQDFIRYEGESVDIGLYAPINGNKQFTGKLLPKKDGWISIETAKGEVLDFDEKAVAVVKRTIIF